MNFIEKVMSYLSWKILQQANSYEILLARKKANIHPSVKIGKIKIDKNVYIGEGTYINEANLFAGKNSKVVIGRFCAIGYNVNIKARTHDIANATKTQFNQKHKQIEGNIIIGDRTWIGDNVFIKHNITIGVNCIIGANSVVTKDIPDNAVVAGTPAKVLYFKNMETNT